MYTRVWRYGCLPEDAYRPTFTSRLSGLKSRLGDPQGAIADLKQAILMGQAHGLPRESIAWTQWQLGNEYFAYGNLPEAETVYQAALIAYPTYHRGLTGLAVAMAVRSA